MASGVRWNGVGLCCQAMERNLTHTVWAVIRTKGFYMPWVFLAFTVLMGGDPTQEIVGLFAGALFWLLADVLPNADASWGMFAGARVMWTPTFLRALVDEAGEGPMLSRMGIPMPGPGAFQGQGRRLG